MTAHRSNDVIKASLVDSISDLLRERGFAGVTMSMVADRAGISRTWAYNFFPDVNAIYKELFNHVQATFFEADEGSFDNLEELPAFFDRHVSRYLDLPIAYAILGSYVLNTGYDPSPEIAELRSMLLADFGETWIEPFVALGVPRGEVMASVIACTNTLFGLVVAMDRGWITREDARSRLRATILVNLQVTASRDPNLAEIFAAAIPEFAVRA
jgi:AcrR family transcriptional regulator